MVLLGPLLELLVPVYQLVGVRPGGVAAQHRGFPRSHAPVHRPQRVNEPALQGAPQQQEGDQGHRKGDQIGVAEKFHGYQERAAPQGKEGLHHGLSILRFLISGRPAEQHRVP